jgi:anti-sigma regulatory factor (Ser/Thr protein kinase)
VLYLDNNLIELDNVRTKVMPKLVDRSGIDRELLHSIDATHAPQVADIAAEFGVSRQTVYTRLRLLEEHGAVTKSGKGKAALYSVPSTREEWTFELQGLEEDRVWLDRVKPFVQDSLSANELSTCSYGLTEMINNAIDHSGGRRVIVSASKSAASVSFRVSDDGVGIFEKIIAYANLSDPREAILELAKGKLTTDPERHSGEGIFFTSKAFDSFTIHSKNLSYLTNREQGWFMEYGGNIAGTYVTMKLEIPSTRTLEEVFREFTVSDEAEISHFSRTRVPLKLAQYGDENLVSRSQAKRVLARFEKFSEVVLDFNDVSTIGQAFADEIFRVFQNQHPDINIVATRASLPVRKMINRARGLESIKPESTE